jgi:aminoglycoside adenylyltransferase-like protein/nucleotidyltransferase-like protein
MPGQRPADEAAALAFAHWLAEICSKLLGDSLLSVILHGSLTFDDYVPGQSDIDLFAIVDHPLSDSEIDLLTHVVTAQRPDAPGPADLRFATQAVATRPPTPPPLELYIRLKTSAPPEIEIRRREPDLIVELSICRQHGRAIHGAPPEELIGDISPESVLSVGDAQLARWQSLTDDAPYAALMVLTACRIWRFSQERIHCSKTAAGTWALRRDPSLDAVRDALRQRTGDRVAIEPAQIARLLNLVRARIAMSLNPKAWSG